MSWFYKTVTFLPERCDNEVLAAKCLSILHGFNYKYDTRSIGVSFPDWCDDTVGKKLTFISTSKAELDLLLKHHYFIQMRRLDYFDISATTKIPDDCEYAAFTRNQSIDKASAAGQARKLRRLEKRAIARGEAFNPALIKQKELIVLPHYHSLEVSSQSKNSIFRLNIQMKATHSFEGSSIFSSYGLSNTENSYQAVPLI
ncbi:type I-F CRISPR-associated endoribonuclease Cas6/Csy4 [Vibrio parahaemolyticus]|nr:type I-F CRISPR-associated endoribonuclease Cas6/Csy4 [Vibrio parahaemolyticus]EHR6682661.1 type I-F CRISPR-associated endoribonuclease Cas6/Csy4 [Vibrio parahaemolyticus]EIV8484583.1 type I-F CRISPR-associated endoribonuclease Cas6/Csy4 [Vibrio parahaemolyticus]EIV8623990.1 type I-F CRISPR-associated endoribonuclease Cas6/Csy4 [Vibrio parahaemolyticus]